MRERHHIYNFHVGFWGALLMSGAIMLQSALFLLFSAAATMAQTAPVTVTSPQASAQFLVGDPVALSAQTATAAFGGLQFKITDSATGQTVFTAAGQSADLTNWTANWTTNVAGALDVVAIANGQTSTAVRINVQNAQAVVVTITNPQATGQTINQDFLLGASTSISVDSLNFILTPTSGTGAPVTLIGTAADQTNTVWNSNLVVAQFPSGQYTLQAAASLQGQITNSSVFSITIQQPAQTPTVTIITPTNQATVTGSVTFKASVDQTAQAVQFLLTGVAGTPTATVNQSLNTLLNVATGTWDLLAPFDTTTIPNGSYALVAAGTFTGQTAPIISQTIGITVNNVAVAQPLAIQSQGLANGTVGAPYAGLLVATGGTLPYTWSMTTGALPPGLTLQGATGNIAGTPTTANTYTVTFQVRDAQAKTATVNISIVIDPAPAVTTNPTAPPPTNTTTPAPAPTTAPAPAPAPTVTATLNITSPASGVKITEGQIVVVIKSNVAISTPSVRLFNTANQNVLAGSGARAVVDGADQTTWNYTLTTSTFPNGSYLLQTVARAQGATSDTLSPQVNLTIENAPKPVSTFTGGSIVAPIANQKVSGRVLLNAKINGTVKSVTFKVAPSGLGEADVPGRMQAGNPSIWEGSWDSTSVPAGTFTVRATVETDTGATVSLPGVSAVIVATTAPLLVAPVPTVVPQPTIAEIVQPEVLQNVNTDQGTLAQTPVECQIVAIKDDARCQEYLRSREIRLLTPAEQLQVKQDLAPIVSRHIDVQNGIAITQSQNQQTAVQDPLSGIIPIDKKTTKDTSLLVVSSTEPPANLKPFVSQTVPAVVTFDQDGDGLSDDAEQRYGTDPNNPDTDGDGYSDGVEVKNGFNPLGSGVLTEAVAPMDQAILNNRPLEQPRFAGAVDKEKIKVDDVSSVDDGKALALKGKSDPYSFVTLYIYSTLPIVVTVQADASGNWQYDFSHPLIDGKHDVYATVTNDTGKIVKKSEPLSFFVRAAQAVTEDQFLATSTIQDTSSQSLMYFVLAGMLIVILGGGLFFYYLHRKERFI